MIDSLGQRIAIVSLDLIGYTEDGGYFGLQRARKLIDPSLGIQQVLLTCTHNHEGPDTIGLWGANPSSDGKFPLYLEFLDRQIAKAVTLAANAAVPVRLKSARRIHHARRHWLISRGEPLGARLSSSMKSCV